MTNDWAERQWGQAPLGDKRLQKRAVKIGEACLRLPDRTLPKKFGTWGDTKGAYRFFNSLSVSHEALQREHNKNVIEMASKSPLSVLFIQDSSELSYNDHPYTNGLGPTADSFGQGILFHTCLAVEWSPGCPPEVLGVAKQIPWIRPDEPMSKKDKEERRKESMVWIDTLRSIGRPPENVQWISVGDRGNDFFDYMDEARNTGWEYVLRGKHNRTIVVDGEEQKLHSWVRGISPGAGYELSLRSRGQKFSREAHLKIAWGRVVLTDPKEHGKTIDVTCVRAYDPEDERLEWILLTSLPVDSAEDALHIVKIYEQRWIIEEYHKCLKTGCKIEEAQLKTANRILALLGILGVVATQLLWLRDITRRHPDNLACEYVEKDVIDAVKSLCKLTGPISMTVKELWRRIAMLGGFLGRKSDGNPGWQTIWSGWLRVQDVLTGMAIARSCG